MGKLIQFSICWVFESFFLCARSSGSLTLPYPKSASFNDANKLVRKDKGSSTEEPSRSRIFFTLTFCFSIEPHQIIVYRYNVSQVTSR